MPPGEAAEAPVALPGAGGEGPEAQQQGTAGHRAGEGRAQWRDGEPQEETLGI